MNIWRIKMKKIRLIALLLSLCLAVSVFTFGSSAATIGKISGDANSDGEVTSQDIILLRQYIANYNYNTGVSTVRINSNADMDGNGHISLKDVIFLREFLANADFEQNQVFTINNSADIDSFINGAMLFCFGENYAIINGSRVEIGDNAPYFERGAFVPADFVEKNGLGIITDGNVTVKNGVRYVSSTAFSLDGKFVYYLSDQSCAIVTDIQWKLAKNSLYDELAAKVKNIFFFGAGATYSAQMNGNRPVLFETDEMLAASKEQAGLRLEPWLTSWQNVLKKANASLTAEPSPYVGTSSTEYRLAACNDFISARSLALAYRNTGDETYLNRAIDYLMAYASPALRPGTDDYLDYSGVETSDGQPDIGLNIAVPLTTACDAYSLIYPYMNDSDKALFESWIEEEVSLVKKGHQYWIDNDYYWNQIGNNHITSHLMGMICAAYVLEDDALLTYAINSAQNDSDLLEMLDRPILMEGDTVFHRDPQSTFTDGEIYDRYRVVDTTPNGFGYAMYHLKFLTYSAFVMQNNGLDFFRYEGTNGENLLLSYKAYAPYLIANDPSINGGYYNGNSLQQESTYTLYLMAYYIYGDETLRNVINALNEYGFVPGDNELFGRSGGYILGKE